MKKLKELIAFCGLNYQAEFIKFVVIDGVLLIIAFIFYFFLKDMLFAIIFLVSPLVMDFLLINGYISRKSILLKQRNDEFITMISYFEVFLNNDKNVYQAFNKLIPYSSTWMKEQLEEFLNQIDLDKSVQPFMDFANKFTSPVTSNVMLSIYQMVDQGEGGEQLTQFTILFEQLNKAHQKDLIDKKEKSLTNVGTFPLAGAGMIIIVLTVCIISVLGDLINVI